MPDHDKDFTARVLLVSAPWALFNRPSLPLGSLKAYLAANVPGIRVQSAHLFLSVAQTLGYDAYQMVSQRTWRAESVFAALMYPERAACAEALFHRTLSKKEAGRCDFKSLVHQTKTVVDRWLAGVAWSAMDLVGFSISFCQVTASLYLISRIKHICPALPVVVGGSSFAGEHAAGLLSAFPGIDYLVLGEGERPLTELVRYLAAPEKERSAATLPQSVRTAGKAGDRPERFCQLERMDDLPMPDYDEYFATLNSFPADQRFFPTLPIEASRGCWWHRSDRLERFKGCAFCNLNLQWQGYRTKPAPMVVREVDGLVQRHQVLSLAFADNALPLDASADIFDGIAKLGYHLSIFAELRANTPPQVLKKMRQAGVDTVQVGIEALSTRLLSKMNKGVRAIDNLNMMKQCEAAGIVCASNLMLHFPSSDPQDVDETLFVLDFCRWYRPLKTVSFWLGLESPVHRFPERFHIRSTFNHPSLKRLFPAPAASAMRFIIQGYRGDRNQQRRLWRPVAAKARKWASDYAVMQRQSGGRPALAVRDGSSFLIIDQHLPRESAVKHRLTGASATIYRYCDVPRRFDRITKQSPTHRPEQIQTFLTAMVDKRLMFTEDDEYLSLAIPAACPP